MIETKTRRINLRTTPHEDTVLHEAAAATDTTVSAFVMDTALARAQEVLADRTEFPLTSEQFDAFQQALDTPVDTGRLAALFARPAVFGQPFHPQS